MDATQLATLRRLDEAHHLHPFTDHADLHRQGTHVIKQASGCFVTDETGQRLLDGLAGLWCVNVGYGRREIADAVHEQMTAVCLLPVVLQHDHRADHPARRQDSPRVRRRGIDKVFFSNSGSEANETALKLIRAYNKLRGRSAQDEDPHPHVQPTTASAWRRPA